MLTNEKSISVIMPTYNEAANLFGAYETASKALKTAGISDYEVLIMVNSSPNGTHDGTPDIATQIAAGDPHVRVYLSPIFNGLGYYYRKGVSLATKNYVMVIPAHNLTEEDSIIEIISHIGQADSIITYTKNPETRPFRARVVSRCFVILCNVSFGLNLRYYNGISIHPRNVLSRIPMAVDNHSYMAEVIIYLAKSGFSLLEVPQILKPTTRAGKAFNFGSAVDNFLTILKLFWKINIRRSRISAIALDKNMPFTERGKI